MSTVAETKEVRETLRLVIRKFTEAAQQHCLSVTTKTADVSINGRNRINQLVYAVDTEWKFVIHAQESVLCVKTPNDTYSKVNLDRLTIDEANDFVTGIGGLIAALR